MVARVPGYAWHLFNEGNMDGKLRAWSVEHLPQWDEVGCVSSLENSTLKSNFSNQHSNHGIFLQV